jgi:alanine racemase
MHALTDIYQALANAGVLSADAQLVKDTRPVQYLLTDSRRLIYAPTTLFFTFGGATRSGLDFVAELYDKGCRMFVVSVLPTEASERWPHAHFINAKDVLAALQAIGSWHRAQFQYPVVAITGSNGKTIVKEWLAQLFSTRYAVVRSPKSFNSQIGVPLSVWEMSSVHDIGLFEAGISKPGEMQHLAQILKPDIGIFTNLGPAHDEGFASRAEKLAEKWRLMDGCNVVIYPTHYQDIDAFAQAHRRPGQVFWSWRYEVIKAAGSSGLIRIRLFVKERSYDFLLPMADGASIENCLQSVVLMLYLGHSGAEIQEGIRNLKPVSMRLEFKEGINDCYVIDDCYSNDLSGLAQALDFMQRQQAYAASATKTLILSDILEAGLPPQDLYRNVAQLVGHGAVHRLVLIGYVIGKYLPELLNPDNNIIVSNYGTTEQFLSSPEADQFDTELILIKGARRFRFESIVQHLQARVHGTRLEINLDAVAHNFNQYRALLQPTTKIMVMVKAFAYGSGSYEIANLLQHHGAHYLAVAYTDEGVSLRQSGITLPIMVMNPGAEAFEKLLDHRLEPVIYSFAELNQFLKFLKGYQRPAQPMAEKAAVTPQFPDLPGVHLELETGMNRLGIDTQKLPFVLAEMNQNKDRLVVRGVFSHLAAADEASMEDFSQEQIKQFSQMAEIVTKALGYRPILHLLNSPGITRFPEAQFDMVRLGIGLYGYDPNAVIQDKLEPVGRLKTTISQIKGVGTDQTVGYSRRGVVKQATRIATLAIGYADGFDRRLGNGNGVVKVNGKRAPIIGNVCMDMTMIDLDKISAQEGDEVIIFDQDLTIQDMAQKLGTIPYEILTKVSSRVKRIFYTELG